MSPCDLIRHELDAYRDGTLDHDRALALSRHLESCPGCSRLHEEASRVEEALRVTASGWLPPARLMLRIQRAAESSRSVAPGRRVRQRLERLPRPALAAAVLLVLVALGAHLTRPERAAGGDAMAVAMVNEFHTFVVSRRGLDISSTSPSAIRDWFTDRLDFRPPTPAGGRGFSLTGGRLCNILDKRVAAYMYQADEAWVSLYITRADAGAADPTERPRTLQGYRYIGWIESGLRYSLVGDVTSERLRTIARVLRVANNTGVASFQSGAPGSWRVPRRTQLL